MAAGTGRRRGEHLRQAILAAASAELAENGIAGATVSAVADRCGVHETTIYRRWGTRENLLVDAALARSAAAIPVPDTGSTRADLIAITQAVADYLSSPAGHDVLNAATLTVDDGYAPARKTFWSSRFTALTPVIEKGVARGDLRPDVDPSLILEALVAPLQSRTLLTGAPITDDLPQRLVDLVLDGAGPGAASLSTVTPTPT